jgi:hypothetical protein
MLFTVWILRRGPDNRQPKCQTGRTACFRSPKPGCRVGLMRTGAPKRRQIDAHHYITINNPSSLSPMSQIRRRAHAHDR